MSDLISRQAAIDALKEHRALYCDNTPDTFSKLFYAEKSRVDELDTTIATLVNLPPAQSEIIRCKDCKHWRRQTNYAGAPLSFGFCESDDMWRSLYGETYEVSHIDTDDDFYCGYAERRTS